MKKQDVCPYAQRQWSSQHMWKPGCKAATTDHCDADKDCSLREDERKHRVDIYMGRVEE